MSNDVSTLTTFRELALIDPVLKALDDVGYETPSPIQAQVIPFMLQGKDVLRFRDRAFYKYFENPAYLNMIEKKFGKKVREHIKEMIKIRLKRKIFEN